MTPEKTSHNIILLAALGLTVITAVALIWFFFFLPTGDLGQLGWYLFSFAAGLTMIVMPCTLPLAFVIVPMVMGKGIGKGLRMALSFGTGVALMLSLYGVIAAAFGKAGIQYLGADGEGIKNWIYFLAGIFAYTFALGEIGLVKFRMPSYTGSAPSFIQMQKDETKAFLLGLFLGNVGVGCPHPATPLILIEIASSGNIFYGWTLFLIHAIGRVIPLLILSLLAVGGINGLSWLMARKDEIDRALVEKHRLLRGVVALSTRRAPLDAPEVRHIAALALEARHGDDHERLPRLAEDVTHPQPAAIPHADDG
jgi:cytochrome c-type biogenesis protein